MNFTLILLFLLSLSLPPAHAAAYVHRFDFGPAGSAAAAGHTLVTPQARYSPTRGWGFTTPPSEAGIIDDTVTVIDFRGIKSWRVKEGIFGLNDLTVDYVAGPEFRFRVDLPDGRYDVVATLGYKHGIHHLNVAANGRPVATDLSVYTYHYAFRGGRDDTSIGAVYRLPFTAQVTGGRLLLEFSGDRTKGKNRIDLTGGPGGATMTVETGGPFTVNSLMGLSIAPHEPLPAAGSLGKAWSMITEAAHPDTDGSREEALMRDAAEMLRRLPGARAAGLLAEAELFLAALQLFRNRETGGTEIGFIGRLHQAHAIWRQFGPDHPFHYKGLIYTGRMFKGMVPFSFTPKSEEGMAVLREVEKKFPRNKYVRLYLHDDWSASDWRFHDYPASGAPKWAETLRRAFCQNLDFAEWWADFRQLPNGSLGGGWNDDVELMPVFAVNWFTAPDASPKVARMVEKFTEGLWASGNLDRRRAFSASFFDAEHAAEDQGNSLPYLIGLQYGNPRYLEWNLRTVQLFRNFLTGVNERGFRHFRSHHYDATRYALELAPEAKHQFVEAAICYRAFPAVPWMVWYNGNPAASKLLLEHADSWLAAAMSEQKGKPRGIMPAQLGFDDAVGGPEASWLGKPGLGGGAEWPAYLWYLNNLLLAAHRTSGDQKYLAPFEETYKFLQRFRDSAGRFPPRPGARPPSDEWIYHQIRSRSFFADAFWHVREMTGDARYDDYLREAADPYVRYRLTGDKNILVADLDRMNAQVKARWPHMTTDAFMTDRVGYRPQMVSYLTGTPIEGGFQGFPNHAVTYANTGRDFAAVVEDAGADRLRLTYYSFAPRPRAVGLRPWRLQPGARYSLTVTPVDDAGQATAAPLETREFLLRERGEIQRVVAPPRQSVQVDVRLIAPAAPAGHRADLAVTARDIRWNSATDQIEATIHNIGAAEAANIDVAFFHKGPAGMELLEKAVISRIGAPLDLNAETVTVGAWNHRDRLTEGDTVVVVVDPDARQREITRGNNQASAQLALPDDRQREELETLRLTRQDRRELGSSAARARTPIKFLRDVVYGAADPEFQRLDAYLAQSAKPAPVVIEFHGGGWRNGVKNDLDLYGPFLRALLEEGVSLVTAGYRLTPRAIHPAQVEDAARVVEFVRGKAKEWNLDPDRIALIGGSAGAHLALWAGLPKEAKVRAIVDLWGPTDLAAISPRVERGEALTALFGVTAEEYEKPGPALERAIREASPVHRVAAGSPPVFIVHNGPAGVTSPQDPRISGAAMGVHSAAFGLLLAERLKKAGVTCELLIAPDAGRQFQPRALEFLRKYLTLEKGVHNNLQ